MLPDGLILDHAVQIYKNSHSVNIIFTVSKYPARNFGELVKKLRLERRLSQKLWVNKISVAGWEKNQRIPRRSNLLRIASFFKGEKKSIPEMLPQTK